MRYDSVRELEAIGRVGAKLEEDAWGTRARYLASFWLYIEPEDQAFTPHWPTGYWESWVSQWLSTQWDSHDLFIDIGANVGYFTMQALKAGKKTIAVEPNPRLIRMLSNTMAYNRVPMGTNHYEIWDFAVSNYNGKATLWVPEGHSGGAALRDSAEGHDVDVFKLDDCFFASSTLHPNLLIKIDAEGEEPKIWEGMQQTLKRFADSTVVLEWHGVRYDRYAFAEELSKHHLTVIQYDGTEAPIDYDWLIAEPELHMICVRPIKENL